MKKFLVRLGVWLFIGMIIAVSLDVIVTTGLRKVDVRKYAVWNDIYKGGIDADLLVIGPSQAWCSYNTFIMDSLLGINSYNLGIDGHSLHFQLIRYETYRRFNPKPKVILVSVNYFGTFNIMADAQYEREQFFPYITDATLIKAVAETKHLTWFDRHLPLYRYFGYRDDVEMGVVSFFQETEFPDGGLYKGYRGNDIGWTVQTKSNDSLMVSPVDMQLVNELERFAKNCCDDDVKLVLVKYPEYYSMMLRVSNLSVSDSIFETISKRYEIPIFDFYYSDIAKDSTCYYNYGHLNKKGSELFTMKLCHNLDSIGVLNDL